MKKIRAACSLCVAQVQTNSIHVHLSLLLDATGEHKSAT